MPTLRILGLGVLLLAGVAGLVAWRRDRSAHQRPMPVGLEAAPAAPAGNGVGPDGRAEFPDPAAPGPGTTVFYDPTLFDDEIASTAERFMVPARDAASLPERLERVAARARRGLAELTPQAEALQLPERPGADAARRAIALYRSLAALHLYEGELAQARDWVEKALPLARTPGLEGHPEADLHALLGILALRQGELENCIACLGPSSCILPIGPEAQHRFPAGSREALRQFGRALELRPGDLRVRWLLNLAAQTLGAGSEAELPVRHRLPLDRHESRQPVPRFENVAPLVGLNGRGPGLAGGSVFDDFDGDGRPDLVATSLDVDRGASFFHNQGDGSFEDRSEASGLDAQPYALNVRAADFDNDGDLDLLFLRGGWEEPARMSLLRNRGDGVFDDVTEAAGLADPIATEAAAWGDFDNDGDLDLYVCGEYRPERGELLNLGRLYRNNGDGTFTDIAGAAGVTNGAVGKGAAWGDFDADGDADLFVSNMSMGRAVPPRLYRNNGDGSFTDVASQVGLTETGFHFSCLFLDYDNDGRLDLYVSDYGASLAEVAGDAIGLPHAAGHHPRLYRNLGAQGFRDVSREVGLDRPLPAMAVNAGDIDLDGDLDLYLGTGWMSYSGLVPNTLLLNVAGRFEDVTLASNTGHLQKGHGISFADHDADGDLDLYVVHGGGYPGDRAYSALFRNPLEGRHWLALKLVGRTANRDAIGAIIRVDVRSPDGAIRSLYRTVGSNGSFGGNTLVQTIGLGDAAAVESVTIRWPGSGREQVLRDLATDRPHTITQPE